MAGLRIGIAGAGIGGLAAAAALAGDGHNVVVHDRFDTPAPVGSGLVIQPVGQQILGQIGALEVARGYGRKVTHMLGLEVHRQRRVLDVAYDPSGKGLRHGLAIHRATLFDAVLQAAVAAGATIETGCEVTGADAGQLTFKDDTQTDRFDLLIDATGAGSPLSPMRARALPYGAVWGTVDWPRGTSLRQDQLAQRYLGARHMVGVLPAGHLPGGGPEKAAIFWSLPQRDIATFRAQPLAGWKAQASALWPEFGDFLTGITDHDQLTPAFYSHGTLRRPYRPGLVHIGDAAHRASPQLGQGANMALLDGYALSLALRKQPDPAKAVALYWRMRRRHLWVYQAMSAAFTPMYQSDSRILPLLRGLVLAPLSRIPPAPGLLARLVCGDLVAPLRGHDI